MRINFFTPVKLGGVLQWCGLMDLTTAAVWTVGSGGIETNDYSSLFRQPSRSLSVIINSNGCQMSEKMKWKLYAYV